jgi:hypothetical protein
LSTDAIRAASYAEQALDLASIIVGLARSHIDPDSLLSVLSARRNRQLEDYLHEFAYSARKMLEAGKRTGFDRRVSREKRILVHALPADEPQTCDLEMLLGRIIHSAHFEILQEALYYPQKDELPWGFVVRSDRDAADGGFFVFTEFLMEEFIRVELRVRDHLDTLKPAGQ